MRAVVLACLVAACGTDPPVAPHSGTRLALREYTFEDGTVLTDRTALRDLDRGEDCTPQRWSDGNRYCTPPAAEVVYVDGQCLTRGARLPVGSDVRYGVERRFDGLIVHMFVLGPTYGGGTGLTWQLENGQCAGPFGDDGNASIVQLVDEVPRAGLAPVVERTTGGARLQPIEVTSDDGLALVMGFHDRDLVLDCVPDPRADEPTTDCAPLDALVASGFTDATCTIPVAHVGVQVAGAIVSAAPGMRSYFAAGDPFAADAVWNGSPSACTHTGAVPGDYIAAGQHLTTATIDRVVTAGGRARLIDVGAGGVTFDDAYVHDTTLGADCAPGSIAGALRCLPSAANATVASRYTDAACTDRIDVAYVTPAPTGVDRFAVDAYGGWRPLLHPIDGPLFEHDGALCTPAHAPAPTVTVYEIGLALAETAFLAVTTP